jgi:hypothetical protein
VGVKWLLPAQGPGQYWRPRPRPCESRRCCAASFLIRGGAVKSTIPWLRCRGLGLALHLAGKICSVHSLGCYFLGLSMMSASASGSASGAAGGTDSPAESPRRQWRPAAHGGCRWPGRPLAGPAPVPLPVAVPVTASASGAGCRPWAAGRGLAGWPATFRSRRDYLVVRVCQWPPTPRGGVPGGTRSRRLRRRVSLTNKVEAAAHRLPGPSGTTALLLKLLPTYYVNK